MLFLCPRGNLLGRSTVFAGLFRVLGINAANNSSLGANEENGGGHGRHVLVGGGTGFVGSELKRALEFRGYRVTVLGRGPGRESGSGFTTWDQVESQGLPGNLTAVVNLAGANVLDPLKRWTAEFRKVVYDSRINSARSLSLAIQKLPHDVRPKTFIQVSGVGFYPPDEVKTYDENSEGGRDGDFISSLARDWEAAAHLPSDCAGVRSIIIRSGVVLGRKGGMIASLYPAFYAGVGGPSASGDQPMPWIHVKDLTGLMIHSIEDSRVSGILNGVAPHIVTNREFSESFASSLWRPCLFRVPEFVWNLVFSPERAEMITKGQRVEPKRTVATGYNFRFPKVDQACREMAPLFYNDEDEMELKKRS